MNFKESLEYLYNLGNEVLAMKLGLKDVRILLAALENPQNDFLKIQVAGTNGKGSTCAFLEAICVSAKIRVGATTSPHLVSITERIKIGGKEIGEEDFARHATRVREAAEKALENKRLAAVPTFFEQVTAIALSAFAEAKVELAILETGLGGRFDAMTAANAEIAAITPIDYDHQRILGNSLTEIAAEKAAIIRKDSRVAVANQPKEAEKVIFKRCADFGIAPKSARFVEAEIKKEMRAIGKRAKTFDSDLDKMSASLPTRELPPSLFLNFKTEKDEYKNVKLSLRGKHQIENAKVALLSAEILQGNFKITKKNIIEGLETAEHKGRLEFYKNFLFDGAHNAAGAKALREFLDESVKQPITMIFGAMKDKDLSDIAKTLFPKAEKLIFTAPDNPRSMKAKDLRKFAPENFDENKIHLTKTVAEAVEAAEKISSKGDLICVTGSLYLIGEAQEILKSQFKI